MYIVYGRVRVYRSVHMSDNIVFSCQYDNKSRADTRQSMMNALRCFCVSFEIDIPELEARG